jgi:uncharacterized damage-inducible protein DinB
MQVRDVFRDLFGHMAWADAMMWKSVKELGKEDKRLHELLQHLHATQRAFFDAWRERPFDRGVFGDQPLDTVEQRAPDYHRDVVKFVEGIEEAGLDRVVRLPWAERFSKGAHATTLGETMLQIASHSTHHRAQVSTRIRELGGEPPLIDFIAWLWQGKPAPPW